MTTNVNQYLLSCLQPEAVAAKIPDQNSTRSLTKGLALNSILQVRQANIDILFDVSFACELNGVNVFLRPLPDTQPTLWVFLTRLRLEQDLSDNFDLVRFVSGVVNVLSATISSSNATLGGTANAWAYMSKPKRQSLTYENGPSYCMDDLNKVTSVPMSEGVTLLSIPHQNYSFFRPVPYNGVNNPSGYSYYHYDQDAQHISWYGSDTIFPSAGTSTTRPMFVCTADMESIGIPGITQQYLDGWLMGEVSISAHITGLVNLTGPAGIVVTVYIKTVSTADWVTITENVACTQQYIISNCTAGIASTFDIDCHFFVDKPISKIVVHSGNAVITSVQPDSYVRVQALSRCKLGFSEPGCQLIMRGLEKDQQIAVSGQFNYEVVPNSDLMRNMRINVKEVDHPMDLEAAEYVLNNNSENFIRFVYPLQQYRTHCENGDFYQMALRNVNHNQVADAAHSFTSLAGAFAKHAPSLARFVSSLASKGFTGALPDLANVLLGNSTGGLFASDGKQNKRTFTKYHCADNPYSDLYADNNGILPDHELVNPRALQSDRSLLFEPRTTDPYKVTVERIMTFLFAPSGHPLKSKGFRAWLQEHSPADYRSFYVDECHGILSEIYESLPARLNCALHSAHKDIAIDLYEEKFIISDESEEMPRLIFNPEVDSSQISSEMFYLAHILYCLHKQDIEMRSQSFCNGVTWNEARFLSRYLARMQKLSIMYLTDRPLTIIPNAAPSTRFPYDLEDYLKEISSGDPGNFFEIRTQPSLFYARRESPGPIGATVKMPRIHCSDMSVDMSGLVDVLSGDKKPKTIVIQQESSSEEKVYSLRELPTAIKRKTALGGDPLAPSKRSMFISGTIAPLLAQIKNYGDGYSHFSGEYLSRFDYPVVSDSGGFIASVYITTVPVKHPDRTIVWKTIDYDGVKYHFDNYLEAPANMKGTMISKLCRAHPKFSEVFVCTDMSEEASGHSYRAALALALQLTPAMAVITGSEEFGVSKLKEKLIASAKYGSSLVTVGTAEQAEIQEVGALIGQAKYNYTSLGNNLSGASTLSEQGSQSALNVCSTLLNAQLYMMILSSGSASDYNLNKTRMTSEEKKTVAKTNAEMEQKKADEQGSPEGVTVLDPFTGVETLLTEYLTDVPRANTKWNKLLQKLSEKGYFKKMQGTQVDAFTDANTPVGNQVKYFKTKALRNMFANMLQFVESVRSEEERKKRAPTNAGVSRGASFASILLGHKKSEPLPVDDFSDDEDELDEEELARMRAKIDKAKKKKSKK